ncbi:MAG: hypothetical protein Q9191_002681, partial [Dirinaria sp. TL-2023a]
MHLRNIRIFEPVHFAKVYLNNARMSFRRVGQAIESCAAQTLQETPRFRLSIEHCQALLSVQGMQRFVFDEDRISSDRVLEDRDEADSFSLLDKSIPRLKKATIK